jgi:hypothetical protein
MITPLSSRTRTILGSIGVLLVGILLGAGGFFAYARFGATKIYDVQIPFFDEEVQTLGYGSRDARVAGADFFEKTKNTLLAEKKSFVEANLTAMNLVVYKDGVETLSVPIKSKGREGSWWETPSGIYRAEGKERNHFSSFGHVYMPWSIPFQGNFFIHGWPYHEDGSPVPEGYSGGCIRLEDTYAEQVYNLVEPGMPILVYENTAEGDSFTYTPRSPHIGADEYLVADLDSNAVLLSSRAQEKRDTQAMANMFTALVASEYQNIDKEVSFEAHTSSSRFATPGTQSIYQIFFPLLMEHDSYAAFVLAHYFGEGRFAGLAEKKLRAMGMNATTLDTLTPSGTLAHTTAEDIFLFLQYLIHNRSFLLSVSAGTVKTNTYGEPVWQGITPQHPLFGTGGFVGGMYAGDVERGYDVFSVLETSFGKEGTKRRIAYIVFGSKDPLHDTLSLKAHVQSMYE